MRIKCLTSERKVLFDLNQLTVFTRHLHKFIPQKLKDPLVPHFRPSTCVAFPSQARSGNCNFSSQGTESVLSELDIKSVHSPTFPGESLGEKGGSHPAYHISYILKHMTASIKIEKFIVGSEVGFVLLKSDWVGNGSISRVDITMTLYEIQVKNSQFHLFILLIGYFHISDSEVIINLLPELLKSLVLVLMTFLS